MKTTTCKISVDENGRQLEDQGSLNYPVACYAYDLKKYPVNWHWHDEFELIFSLNNDIKIFVGKNEFQLEKENACFINSGVLHSVCSVGNSESVINSIVFHPKLIGGMDSVYWQKYIAPVIEDKSRQFVKLDCNDNEIINLLKTAFECEFTEVFGYEFEVRSALSKIILMLVRYKIQQRYTPTNQQLRDMERVKVMISYIEKNFAEDLKVYDIAKVASLSESECLRCFKRSTGFTTTKFLKDFRLQKAAELIRTTQNKITDIALQCGFSDFSYFSESFRNKFGSLPKNYKAENF